MEILPFLILPFLASLILTGIHSYLGVHVVERGVIFVDLALAQIAARRGEDLRAVPDDGGKDDRDRDIERGDREDAPANRKLAQPVQRADHVGGRYGRGIGG